MASRAVKAPLKKKLINRTVDEYSDSRGIEPSVEYSNPSGPRSMEPTNRGYPNRQMQIQQIQQKQMDVLQMVEAQKMQEKRKVAQAAGHNFGNNTMMGNQYARGEHSEERRPIVVMGNLKVPQNQKLNVRIMKRDYINAGQESIEDSVQESELDSPGLPSMSIQNSAQRSRAESKAFPIYVQNENSQGTYGEFPGESVSTPLKKAFRVKKVTGSPQNQSAPQNNHKYAE